MRPPFILLVALAGLLGGCASMPSWVNPLTWGSSREGKRVEAVTLKMNAAEDRFLKEAQRLARETQFALLRAPKSRAVDVATESNDAAVTALDQLAGPMTVAEVAALRKQVDGLISEVAQVRTQAESEREIRRAELRDASDSIYDLTEKLKAANIDLKAGFERENVKADKYRNLVFGVWALGGVCLVLTALWLYARFALGGIPQGIGRGLALLRAKSPAVGEQVTAIFDDILDQRQKRAISKHA